MNLISMDSLWIRTVCPGANVNCEFRDALATLAQPDDSGINNTKLSRKRYFFKFCLLPFRVNETLAIYHLFIIAVNSIIKLFILFNITEKQAGR